MIMNLRQKKIKILLVCKKNVNYLNMQNLKYMYIM